MSDREMILTALKRLHPATELSEQNAPDQGLTHSRYMEFVHDGRRYDDDGKCPIEYYSPIAEVRGSSVRFDFDEQGAITRVRLG